MKQRIEAKCWYCSNRTKNYDYVHLTQYPWSGSAYIRCNKCKKDGR